MQRYSLPGLSHTQVGAPAPIQLRHTPLSATSPENEVDIPQDWAAGAPQAGKSIPKHVVPHLNTPKKDEQSEDSAQVHHDMVLFVRGVLTEAIRRGASDVHIEPRTSTYRIRFRVDGVMTTFVERSDEEYSTVVSTVKVLADLDIAEHVLPQDGHLELVLQHMDTVSTFDPASENQPEAVNPSVVESDRYYDIRVSLFPSVNGEVAVMRILNRASAILSVEELGMDAVSLERLRNVLLTSYGMFLITGPTGSGKTTTLYSILSELRSDERNIITLEDPIEFHLDWMRQCEIREERGFTFERAMESVLRQDPDILMVGEIRDPVTAAYAVRSALVGRIVGSTIHANTAVGTIARLLDLGISRSLVASSIQGVIAQRLVRQTCAECKVPYTPQAAHLAHFGLDSTSVIYYKGKGCDACNGSGYKGRTGIFSVMIFSDLLRSYIFDQRSLADLQDLAIQEGMRTLKMDAANKIIAGLTTVEEAIHVV